MILMNITSPSSSLEQTNFEMGDRGTNPSDSSIEFSFCTCSVEMEDNGPGHGCGSELVFPRLPSSSCPISDSLTQDSSDSLVWIVKVLIELWMWAEHFGSIIRLRIVVKGWFGIEPLGVTKIVLLELESIPLTSRFIGFFVVKVTELTTNRLVNGSSCEGIDTVIKNLDLEPKVYAMMRGFLDPSPWKELSKESGSKILLCGDGSCWKTFKPISSLIAKGKLKQTNARSFPIVTVKHYVETVTPSITAENIILRNIGVDFRRWQKKMHFLLSSMSMMYVLTTQIPEDGGDNPTVEQVRKRAKWDNDDYVYRGLLLNGMADSLFDIH
nr:zinc finger, CCHC-type [Tanacetum cinerariifolium]